MEIIGRKLYISLGIVLGILLYHLLLSDKLEERRKELMFFNYANGCTLGLKIKAERSGNFELIKDYQKFCGELTLMYRENYEDISRQMEDIERKRGNR
tara:strand:+ start:24810 stop:25103 length:294 start_codon:yes stop_codon:yes gene_type:complete